MAVTGSGTELNPWVVHSYDELQTVSQMTNGLTETFIKLANDINCNAYANNFEWETVNLGVSGTNIKNFDLNGYTIKNIKVKANNKMFDLIRFNSVESSIYNGKLLNVFLNEAQCGISGVQAANLSQLSMSFDETGVIERSLASCHCEDCAVYVRSSRINSGVFFRGYSTAMFKNCDIQIDIDDLNGSKVFETSSGNINEYFNNCRITGKVKGRRYGEYLFGYGAVNNCVIDVDMLEVTGGNGAIFYSGSGIINADKIGSINSQWLTRVTSQEIINGNALRSKEFEVVNVVGG